MSTTMSPNMNLIVPGVGSEPGPNWAQEVNSDLAIIDSHNHSSGQGIQVQPNGLNINADLTFLGNNAINLKSARFTAQLAAIPNSAPNVGCVYVTGNELYYNDVTGGNQIQITKNGNVNSGAGSISGLPFSGAASYAGGTYTWEGGTSGSPFPATMSNGPVQISPTASFATSVTIQAYSALAASYTITLPTALPLSNGSFLTSDTSGNLSYSSVDFATLTISGGILSVNTAGIQTANIADGAVTNVKLGPLNYFKTSSSGTFTVTGPNNNPVTNLSGSLTTSGKPVMVMLQPDGTVSTVGNMQTTAGSVGSVSGGSGALPALVQILNGATVIASFIFQGNNGSTFYMPPSAQFVDTSVIGTPGTYTYSVNLGTNAQTSQMINCVLIAYELP